MKPPEAQKFFHLAMEHHKFISYPFVDDLSVQNSHFHAQLGLPKVISNFAGEITMFARAPAHSVLKLAVSLRAKARGRTSKKPMSFDFSAVELQIAIDMANKPPQVGIL